MHGVVLWIIFPGCPNINIFQNYSTISKPESCYWYKPKQQRSFTLPAIYIYTHLCVCVCVCVCARARTSMQFYHMWLCITTTTTKIHNYIITKILLHVIPLQPCNSPASITWQLLINIHLYSHVISQMLYK